MYTATDLAAVLDKLPAKDIEFASSLVAKARRWEPSEGQAKWINILCQRARGEAPAQPERPKIDLGNLARVIELFDKAGKNLKHPKIMLRVGATDNVLKLNVASERSKHPGTINVTSPGKFGENTWYGRIKRDGLFVPSSHSVDGLIEALQAFAADPAKIAADYGRWRGNCCFCSRQLDDKRSTEVGYGPICAENFGLPWGVK